MKSIQWHSVFYPALLFMACCGCKNEANNTGTIQTDRVEAIDIHAKMEISGILGKYPKTEFHIGYDPALKKEKTYLGVQTSIIFNDLVQKFNLDTAQYDVTFYCKDGYSPTVHLTQLLEHTGYIATKDVHATGNWDKEIEGSFSPAYLVWDISENYNKYAYPYGIVHIQFVEKKAEYLLATPLSDDKTILDGFAVFKEKCIKCHSINKEGGVMGPELNIPKSVTEYWKKDQLKLFIKDPASFRLNSKMPFIAELDEHKINAIVAYLTFMASQKRASND